MERKCPDCGREGIGECKNIYHIQKALKLWADKNMTGFPKDKKMVPSGKKKGK